MRPDGEQTLYEGRVLALRIERWGVHEREVVVHAPAVTVLAVDRDDRVAFVRQLREPARRRLLELPAGSVDPGEEPLAAARRELAEETGLAGGEWRAVASFWTTPGFCTERMHLFVAEGVEHGPARPEEDEDVELVLVPAAGLEELLPGLEDAKTLTGVLLYLRERVWLRRPR